MLKQLNNLPLSYVTVDVTATELQLDIVTERSNFSLPLGNLTTSNVLEHASATSVGTEVEYEQFLADIWVGVLLTLMVLSCVCCMCSCLLYHKFQQWKQAVIESRNAADIESAQHEVNILPSYTIASGLPSYEEALSQLKTVKEFCRIHNHTNNLEDRRKSLLAQWQVPQEVIVWLPTTPTTPRTNLSITDIFQVYRRNSLNTLNVTK